MNRSAGAPWFVPCGTTCPRPARRLESFLGERRGELLPLQRRAGDVRFVDAAAADGNQLGEDADGDLFGRNGADVEPDGRMDARETLDRHPLLDQRVVDLFHLRLAADETDVPEVARRQRTQRVEVVPMP